MVRIATITLVASTRRMPQAASVADIPSGAAMRVDTDSCALAAAIGMAPSSSAVGLRCPSSTSASVNVGSPPPRP
jgi:hypothetical protein